MSATEHREAKTIDACIAAARSAAALGLPSSDLAQLIIGERNAAVHIGVPPTDPQGLVDRLATWLLTIVRAGTPVGPELERKVASSIENVKERVDFKRSSAKRRVRDTEDPMLLKSFAAFSEAADHVDAVSCPVCNHPAERYWTVVDVEHFWSGGDVLLDVITDFQIGCPYCGLTLSDTEIDAAMIDLKELQEHE